MLETTLRAVVRVDAQGRLLVPKELRDAVDMRPGENVTLLVQDGEIRLLTVTASTRRIREIAAEYPTPGRSLVDELIAERRAEAERD
jgi:AbrB family looped-hinge helix DNA binding protein